MAGATDQAGIADGSVSTISLGQFPRPLTSFVGRSDAIVTVAELLGRHRLVTLTGPGGCGKTRLAIAVADQIGPNLGRRAFVDLAPLESPGLVVNALAGAVGVPEGGALPLAEVLCNALADHVLLVVLDNCEHLVEECAALVTAVLSRCPGVHVLATSREPLGVEGEVTWRVPPLSLPPADVAPDEASEALSASEAGALFLERARRALPDYRPTAEDAAAAVVVCRRLDGIPLAIELAASRLSAVDPRTLAATLDDRFLLLESGPRTVAPRQRTLEASIEWSYGLLDQAEQVMFRRLGVFSGAFDVEAAAGVCADADVRATAVLAMLGRLADRSVLQVERGLQGVRFRMLETIRHFARIRLAQVGEESVVRDRHLRHHLEVAERFVTDVEAPTATDAEVQATAVQLDDFRSAMDWSLASDQVDLGLRLGAALRWLWVAEGRIEEGRDRLAKLLAADQGKDVQARAAALATGAMLALFAADPLSQRDLATESLAARRTVSDRTIEGEALTLLGWASIFLDPPAAPDLLTQGLVRMEEAGLQRLAEYGQLGLGVAHANAGRLEEAAAALTAAVERSRPARSWAAQLALAVLGYVETLGGDLEVASGHLREALSGAYSNMFQNQTRQWYGLTCTYRGEYEEAASAFALAEESSRGFGVPLVPGWLHYAMFELVRSRPVEATLLATRVLPFFQVMGWRWFETQARRVLGDAAAAEGDAATAGGHRREAMAAAKASGNPLAETVACLGMAHQARIEDDPAQADTLLRSSLRAAVGADYQLGVIDSLEMLAVLAAVEPRDGGLAMEDAARLLAAAAAARRRIGYVRSPGEAEGFEAATAAAREALGSEYERCWDEGSALSTEEAAALAHRGRSRPPRPPSGWASVTPAEMRVVQLVAEGLSNPEIGERLFISRRTVQTHLSRVFAKLQVSGRAELAALVSRRVGSTEESG
jgi:predicted ATPase/DNA-binding CsgD family transcriptional regulator